MPLEIDPIVARHVVEKYGERAQGRPLINSHSAKGVHIIFWEDKRPWYWLDRKTDDYPVAGYAGKLVFRGGNWNSIDDKNPLDVYLREVAKEETAQTGVGRFVRESVRKSHFPFADFLEVSPASAHKGSALASRYDYLDGTVFGMASLFETSIDGYELLMELRRANPKFELTPENLEAELRKILKESGVAVVTTEQIKSGEMPEGGWGDDQKLALLVKERGYIVDPKVPILEGVECHRLSSSPLKPFEERGEVPLYRVNPLREAAKDSRLFR